MENTWLRDLSGLSLNLFLPLKNWMHSVVISINYCFRAPIIGWHYYSQLYFRSPSFGIKPTPYFLLGISLSIFAYLPPASVKERCYHRFFWQSTLTHLFFLHPEMRLISTTEELNDNWPRSQSLTHILPHESSRDTTLTCHSDLHLSISKQFFVFRYETHTYSRGRTWIYLLILFSNKL